MSGMRIFLILLLLVSGAPANSIIQGLNVSTIEVMEGGRVDLPCNISPLRSSDKVSLILWFKEDDGKPIYSVEVPPGSDLGSLPPQSYWSSSDHFSSRARFRGDELSLTGLKSVESGTYRCRVDFNEAQTRSTFIHLSVIEAVESVLIVDEEGKDRSTFVGPYLQGQSVKLKCIAVKGHPSPKVEWFRNRESLGSSWVILENRTVVSELEIHNLSRSDLHSELSCRVSNNNISAPTTITVHVDMNFSPSSVRLEGGDDEMIVGKTYTVTCIIEGSRPPPVVTWFINSKRIEGVQDTSTGDGTLSRSKLNFNPGVEDVDKVLLCKAFNPVVLGSEPVSSEISLNISYAPRVLIGLGKSISPNTVYEGGDVYFDCKVQALPPSTRISWIHNGVELRQDVENGILFTNYSLVLQKITRELSGSYSCEAWSRVGRGQSQELLLDVKYVPVCKSVQPMIYGVSKRELVNVLCEVEANPADVEFRWTFNNSAELIKVPTGRPENNFSTSLLSYTPVTAMDYGTLMCSAKNQVGHQKLPCVYHIIMAVTPDPVENCTVINKSSESFHLQCLPGFDGGMNQTFHITVKERENGIVMYDDSNLLKPDVNIQHLKPGGNYLVSVTSYNKKGTSQPNHIDIETMQPPESQQVEVFPVEEEKDVSWQVGAGVIAGIFLCIMVATVLILSVQRHCRKPSQGDTRLILDTAETHLASSSTCSNIIICSSPSHPNLHRTDCTLIRERFCNSRDPGELGLSPSRSLISEENASGQTIQRCRKGILKRNQDCDSSRQDQATCIRQDQATTNIMEDPLYTVESLSLQPRAGSRNTRTPEIGTIQCLPVRCEKDGLLTMRRKTSGHFQSPEHVESCIECSDDENTSSIVSSYPREISSNLNTDISTCSHSLKRKKQESMV